MNTILTLIADNIISVDDVLGTELTISADNDGNQNCTFYEENFPILELLMVNLRDIQEFTRIIS